MDGQPVALLVASNRSTGGLASVLATLRNDAYHASDWDWTNGAARRAGSADAARALKKAVFVTS